MQPTGTEKTIKQIQNLRESMENIKIIQDNVQHWDKRKFNLTSTYSHINPNTITINSHKNKDNSNIKIPGYLFYTLNTSNEINDLCHTNA